MKCKYLFGSKMLKLENAHDEDWLIFVDCKGKEAAAMGCRSIPLYKAVIGHFNKGKNIKRDYHKAVILYQLSVGFINDADYPFKDFNILEHKEVWNKWLKAYINHAETESLATKTDTLPKQFYHLLYQYHMIIENIHFISDEAKVNVQKIHDLEMPSSYFYELRDLINSL